MQGMCHNCFEEKNQDGHCQQCGYSNISNIVNYPLALREGSMLADQYVVGRVLGQGGFGITYLAFDYKLRVKVAIKEFLPEGMAVRTNGEAALAIYSGEKQESFDYGVERFLEEARVLAKFMGSRNIASVRNYFNENNTAYFVMEYIEGISFKNHIKIRGGKLKYRETLRILLPVMDALTTVHREGIIHRDVTPDNIYITKDNEIKLLDFGSARYSIGDKSKSLDVVLKMGYAPKEQYLRHSRQGAYTDVYALAACFYVAITGILPPESLERMENDELVKISAQGIDIPARLENAIMKGLEVNAADRFQNMEEFKAAVTHGTSVSKRNAKGSPKRNIFKKLKKQLIVVSGIFLGVIIIATILFISIREAAKADKTETVTDVINITTTTADDTLEEPTETESVTEVEPTEGENVLDVPDNGEKQTPPISQKSTQEPSIQNAPIVKDLEYISANGQVAITKYRGSEADIIIPQIIDELPVTVIKKSAFEKHETLTSVTLPNGVNLIEDRAFNSCSLLNAVYFEGNAPKIGEEVFGNTASNFRIYYKKDTRGWTNPWNGYSASGID